MGIYSPANVPEPPAILEPFAAPIIAAEAISVEKGLHTVKCHILIRRNRPEGGGYDWIVQATVVWHPEDYEDALLVAGMAVRQ